MTVELTVAIASAAVSAVSALAAVASWRVSRRMATSSEESSAASQSSADSAQRSATAAEESLAIQRGEADAASEARRRVRLADVVPLYWEGRVAKEHRGLVIRNNGPSVAKEIAAYEKTRGGKFRKWEWPALAASETVGLVDNEKSLSSEEAGRIGDPRDEGAYAYARIEWLNADGSAGLADWRGIEQRH